MRDDIEGRNQRGVRRRVGRRREKTQGRILCRGEFREEPGAHAWRPFVS